MTISNAKIIARLEEYADLLEVQGANPFRVRAYRNSARTIEGLTEEIATLVVDPGFQLTSLPGIGADLAQKVTELLETGSFEQLDTARKEVPAGVLEMLRVPGLGPKKVAALYEQLQVKSLADLKAAAESGQVATLKGFGAKTEKQILAGIESATAGQLRMLIDRARSMAGQIAAVLRATPGVTQVEIAGSARRWRESCGDLDLVAVAEPAEPAMDALASHPLVEKTLLRGPTKQRVRLVGGAELDLRVVPEASFGAALIYFTGSKEHNIVLRRRSEQRGLKLNEYGLFQGEHSIAGTTEAEVYKALDLPLFPPELREDRLEFRMAEVGPLPRLIERSDLRGDLHMHTTESDGTASFEDMAHGAAAAGLKYIAITDHSPRVTMANGLNPQRLRAQWDAIRAKGSRIGDVEILCGIECDILEDGRLDLPDEVLAEADWVIAVLHYGLRQPREQIMLRLMNAVKNPYVDVIGHPTGRLINSRPGADIDMPEFLKAAADHGTLLEINADPARLDLNDLHAAMAKERGIPIVIDSDSHRTTGFENLVYGVHTARRAGLTSADVANCWSLTRLKARLKRNRT